MVENIPKHVIHTHHRQALLHIALTFWYFLFFFRWYEKEKDQGKWRARSYNYSDYCQSFYNRYKSISFRELFDILPYFLVFIAVNYFLVTIFRCSFRFPDISIDTSISRMISLDNAFTTYYSSTKLMTVKSESNASSSMVPLAPR